MRILFFLPTKALTSASKMMTRSIALHTPPSHSVTSAIALVGGAARTRHRTQDGALARQGTRVALASVALPLSETESGRER